ncbi:MAG: RNA polymerase factor sigma-54 [Helicobacteraceae bacterium]|jgi:RNA polymerase sigma-54 factor|nr:RNA polymerase factor sigma-54 [Helicobacteraceae bacterium]
MSLRRQVGGVVQAKYRMSATMRNWLPLLQCSVTDLESRLRTEAEANPFLQITPNQEISYDEHDPESGDRIEDEDFLDMDDNYYKKEERKHSLSDVIEATTLYQKSLYDALFEQVTDHLFPTPQSKAVAFALINAIGDEGFFEGDIEQIAAQNGVRAEFAEKVRRRFEHFMPSGVGAKDIGECFVWQLREYDLDEKLYQLTKTLIYNRDNLSAFCKEEGFGEAIAIFRRLRNPPAIEFLEDSAQIIPDIFVFKNGDELEVELNDPYYPKLTIETTANAKKDDFVRAKLKEARDLIDAVSMRRKTLKKIGLMIVDRQYDFFKSGADIAPMKLADISEDLRRNCSTISRAISGKYLACDRGVFALKSFFSIAIDDANETSTRAIKDYLIKLIKEEPRQKPLSDQKLLRLIEAKFSVKMVRRTITKYREQLDVGASGERKRLYLISERR